MRLTGDRGFAEDVVQETMLRAWRHPKVLDQSEMPARAWLFTVSRRIVIDEWRRGRSRRETPTADLPENPTPADVEQQLQRWQIEEALAMLSPAHREALVECFYRGYSVDEAARRLGIPAGTVKSRCHYALRALQLILSEMGVGDV